MTPEVPVTPRPATLSGVSAGLAALVLFAGITAWHGGASAQTQEIGRPFQDCDVCPEMVVVPPGSFVMGSPESERGHQTDEGPLRHVTIERAFAIGKYEVTLDEFTAFVRDTGYSKAGRCTSSTGGGVWRNPGFRESGRHPVTCIRWPDAGAYARWLSRKTGQVYRLPSESEWEYAARAGTETARYWGDRKGRGNAVCEHCGSKWDNRRTAPVGSFAPNAYGLYDMLGNTWEWVEDCYATSYAGAPRDGGPRIEGDCRNRVMRGGSWESNAGRLRAANRNDHTIDEIDNDFGFRLVRDVAPGDLRPRPDGQEIATLQIIGPNVTVNRNPASNGMAIRNGDYIATGPASRARLDFLSGGYVQLEENTDPGFWEDLAIAGKCVIEFVAQSGIFSSETGNCDLLAEMLGGNKMLAQSKFVLTANPASSVLTILEGRATVGDERAVQVEAGEQVVISRGVIGAPRRLNDVELRLLNDYLSSYDFTGQRPPQWPVAVPRIEGLGFEAAARILSRAGLGLKRVGERSAERFPPGAIVEQLPEAGAKVPRGTAVHVFTVKAEANGKPLPIPDLTIDKAMPDGLPRPGGLAPVVLRVRNLGGATAPTARIVVTDRLPVELAPSQVPTGTPWDCRVVQTGPFIVRCEFTGTQGPVPPGDLPEIVLHVKPGAPPRGDLVRNCAEVNGAPSANNKACIDVRVAAVLVPNLRNLTVPEAERRLAQVNLRLGGVNKRESDSAVPGRVFAQQPGPGSGAPPGSHVSVTVATAPTTTKVPQLIGSSLAEADRLLSDAHLRRGRVSEQLSEFQAKGTIIGQSLKPGAMVPRGSIVDVTRALAARRVPNLIGETLLGAQSRLSGVGLSIGKVATEATQKFKPETVKAQSPGAGKLVRLGTAVHVTVAKPLKPTTCTAPKIDGLTYAQAMKVLAGHNLQGKVRGKYVDDSNTVYRQDPRPGVRFLCSQPISFDLGTIG